jgi:hypothetical protein
MATSTKEDVAVLRTEIHELKEDLKELKASTKRLEVFMYQFEGGKAWMFGLITVAAALGAIVTNVFKYAFTSH